MTARSSLPGFFVALIVLSGCATTTQHALDSGRSQVQSRSIQTRAFDTTDKEKMMRTVISTLQDLDFVLDKADFDLGTVSATKFVSNQVLRISVTVRDRGETQLLVRANAQFGIRPVDDPKAYQDFFANLERALFLTAHQVD